MPRPADRRDRRLALDGWCNDLPVTSVRRPAAGSTAGRAGWTVGGLGLLALVVGTFLPWLRSGSVLRNSYQTVGIARRLTPLGDGVQGVLTAAWPAVGIAAALCAALYVVGARRISAVAVVLLCAIVGTVATLAMVSLPASDSPVRVIPVGPVVTLGGAVLALVGALTLLAWPRNEVERQQEEQ